MCGQNKLENGTGMKIRILGTESLGVRGLCCSVELIGRKILIDPGIALGWKRRGFLPHPFQVAVGARTRETIITELENATDVVFSHFDGDHVPLSNANPYQLRLESVKELLSDIRIWAKGAERSSEIQKRRREAIERAVKKSLPNAEGQTEGPLSFSSPVPHGLRSEKAVSVMMTRIKEEGEIFVHASDVQLLNEDTVEKILAWNPNIVFTSGPPLYLSILSEKQRQIAKQNALRLAQNVEILIVDHHLLRSEEGVKWLKEIASAAGNRVICAADFMQREPLYLEAWRKELYEWLPVPEDWHENYKRGDADLNRYQQKGWEVLFKKGKIKHYSPHVAS